MTAGIRLDTAQFAKVTRQLDALEGAKQRSVTMKASSAAAGVFKRAVTGKATQRSVEAKGSGRISTGALSKSIVVRKLRSRKRDEIVYGIRARSRTETYRVTKSGKHRKVSKAKVASWRSRGAVMVKRNPAKYAHLVELGHGGPHPAPPYPFMRPAFDANVQRALDTATRKFETEIERMLRSI